MHVYSDIKETWAAKKRVGYPMLEMLLKVALHYVQRPVRLLTPFSQE